jgi:hypothetical protein
MGSVSAMKSVEMVLKTHGVELREEAVEELPRLLIDAGAEVWLANETDSISRTVVVTDSDGSSEVFELRRLDLYELADRYPELDLGW